MRCARDPQPRPAKNPAGCLVLATETIQAAVPIAATQASARMRVGRVGFIATVPSAM